MTERFFADLKTFRIQDILKLYNSLKSKSVDVYKKELSEKSQLLLRMNSYISQKPKESVIKKLSDKVNHWRRLVGYLNQNIGMYIDTNDANTTYYQFWVRSPDDDRDITFEYNPNLKKLQYSVEMAGYPESIGMNSSIVDFGVYHYKDFSVFSMEEIDNIVALLIFNLKMVLKNNRVKDIHKKVLEECLKFFDKTPDLDSMKMDELRKLAREKKIVGYSKLKKQELIKQLSSIGKLLK